MLKICILLLVLLCDLVFFRVYSSIGRKNYERRLSSKNAKTTNLTNKKSKNMVFCKIMGYLLGLYYLNIFIVSAIPSFTIRKFIYKHVFLMKIGKASKIREFVEILSPWNITIGENCIIGKNCILDGRNGIKICNNVNISDGCAIWTEQHDINDKDFGTNNSGGSVFIGDRVWLCFRSVVLPKTKINNGVVLATNAVATKECEGYSLYAGIPAKKINDRNQDLEYELNSDWAHIY